MDQPTMEDAWHATAEELEAGLDEIRGAPKHEGVLALLVRRPRSGEREILKEGELDLVEGLVGDDWKARGSPHTKDGAAHPERQLTIMSARVIALLARDRDRWALAGDQLFIDMDLSADNVIAPHPFVLAITVTSSNRTGCRSGPHPARLRIPK